MKLRRRSLITREGWYYLFILGFVIVGSLLRHINLLVGLSAILSTAMIFNWRITRAGLRHLRFARKPTPPVWCHRPTTFEVEVENQRRYLTSFSIMVNQRFRPKQVQSLPGPPPSWWKRVARFLSGNSVSNYVLLDAVHVGQTRVAQQIVEFRDRGQYEMGPLTVSTHYPLGLTRREVTDTQRYPLFVGPALGSLTYGWVDRMLGLGWQDAAGGATSRSGEEFFSLRPWMNGDSRRWVHWRATARHGTVLVRQFQRSQSRAFSLIVDLSHPEAGENEAENLQWISETEKMLRILATISHSVRDGHADTARIILVADQVHQISFPSTESDWVQWHQTLATIQPSTRPDGFLDQLLEHRHQMGLGGIAGEPPAVVLSLFGLDHWAQRVRDREARRSQVLDEETGSSLAQPAEKQPTGTGHQTATAIQTRPKRDSLDAGNFWSIQRQIRTWLTPGDSRLSSWYIDSPQWKTDPTDLNVSEESD